MSPEMILCQSHGVAVDCWAYGVLLCELLTGSNPFTACGDTCKKVDGRKSVVHIETFDAGTMAIIAQTHVSTIQRRLRTYHIIKIISLQLQYHTIRPLSPCIVLYRK